MPKYRITFLNEPDRQPLILEADRVSEAAGRFSFTKGENETLVGSFVNINFAEVTPEEEAAAAATPKQEAGDGE